MEEIETLDDIDFTEQDNLEEISLKVRISSGISSRALTRGGVVFQSEIGEAVRRTEGERNKFSNHLEEIKKCASVRDVRGEDDGKMKQVELFLPHVQAGQEDIDISSYNRANIAQQLRLKMLPREEQVKARIPLLAKQLETLSPGDLKWDEFERAEMEKS